MNNVRLLLENLNKEPAEAEVHYLAHTLEEWRYYWPLLSSSSLRLSFTVNHAHLVPEGIAGFVNAMPMERVAEGLRAVESRSAVKAIVTLAPGQKIEFFEGV